MNCKGSSPPALCGHAACVVDNRMYIHGGFADEVSVYILAYIQCMAFWLYYSTQTTTTIPTDMHSLIVHTCSTSIHGKLFNRTYHMLYEHTIAVRMRIWLWIQAYNRSIPILVY